MNKVLITHLALILAISGVSSAGESPAPRVFNDIESEGTPLELAPFIQMSSQSDTEFEEILIDQLDLRYQKDLRLPAGDLILSARERLVVFLTEEPSQKKSDTALTLSKLFPYTGTEIKASYEMTPKGGTEGDTTLSFSLSQPIAENAFGHSTRLLDKIVGRDIDIAMHQIIEAYEDYLAILTLAYLDWYESYENLLIGRSSYTENLKLLDNMKERAKSKIALPIDVNKITLQVLSKKDKLADLEEIYYRRLNIIETALRRKKDDRFVPSEAGIAMNTSAGFQEEYPAIRSEARTYRILDLLKENSGLEVERAANDLLPSINLLVQYDVEGKDYRIERKEKSLFAGLSMDWPLPDTVERAEHETAKINQRRTDLTITNVHYRLYTQLKNLYQEIQKEHYLTEVAEEKIRLATSVLEDESENYRFGRTLLNDYIQAVNALDDNRFNLILHRSREQKLIIEYRRLSDRLVSAQEVADRK